MYADLQVDDARDGGACETLALLIAQVKRFLDTQVDARAIDREGKIPAALLRTAGDLGLFGITIPEEHGGAGLDLGAACRVVTELARVDRSIAVTIGLHAGLGSRALVRLGSRALRDAWLPSLASGHRIAAFAATEAGAGSALNAVRTIGRIDGDTIVLDGEKSYVTNGAFAGVFTVLAHTPSLRGDGNHSLVLVPADAPGISVGREEEKLGIRGSSTVTVRFDGVRVPLDHVLGELGTGMAHAHEALAWGRTLLAAGCVGTARAALDATLAHVAGRRQFGRAIGDFAASRAHVAAMATRVYAMESLVEQCSAAANDSAKGEQLEVLSSVAKIFCSEGAFETVDRAVQLHGALGFLEPVGVARMLRDCRVTRIFEGANDVLLVRLGTARVTARGALTPRPPVQVPGGPPLHGAIAACDALAARTEDIASELRTTFGVAAARKQPALQRIARAAIAHAAASAALLRATASACPEARDLASVTIEGLVEEGHQHLAAIPREIARELCVSVLTDQLYARHAASSSAAAREVVP